MQLTIEQKEEILNGAQKAFFAAMLDGYCGDKKNSTKVVDDDGTVTITFILGNYKVVDCYHKNQLSNYSSGTTTIFYRFSEIHKWMPVWWMSYSGHYPKEVIPFLKRVLADAYSRKIFYGGRGLESVIEDKCIYTYENECNHRLRSFSFHEFGGYEAVYDWHTRDKVGCHDYFGGALI